MTDISERDFGKLETKVEHLEGMVKSISEDMKAVRSILDQAKGSWKLMVGVATLSSAVTAGIFKLWSFWISFK